MPLLNLNFSTRYEKGKNSKFKKKHNNKYDYNYRNAVDTHEFIYKPEKEHKYPQ